jgi:hypothetical protein
MFGIMSRSELERELIQKAVDESCIQGPIDKEPKRGHREAF